MKLVAVVPSERGTDARALGHAVGRALDEAKVVHVRSPFDAGAPVDGAYYEEVAGAISELVDPERDLGPWPALQRERWIEVTADPAKSQAERDRRRPLHSDEAAAADPAHVLLMYCEAAARRGGGNLFLDAGDVVRFLGALEPELLDELRARPVRFTRHGDARTMPIVGERDGHSTLNWDETALDEEQDAAALELAARFARTLESPALSARHAGLALERGEAMVWWDDLVLHGRARAEVGGERRHFRKTGVVLSSLRAAARRAPA